MALTRITKGVIKPNENYDTHNINSTGIVTAIGLDINGNGDISGNLSVGGVLTYEDVTSIDSVGIITAQQGIHVGAGVSAVGVGTFGSLDIGGDIDVDGHTNLDNVSIAGVVTATTFVGALTGTASGNTTIIGAGNNKIVTSYQNNELVAENNLTWTGSVFETSGGAETWTMRAKSGGPSSKIGFQNQYLTNGFTIGCGAANQSFVVYTGGNNERVRIDSTGITTFSQNLFASKDFDVDGHANLDNVSVAGVTTFSDSDIFFKNSGITSCKFDSNLGQFYFNGQGGLSWYKNGNLSNSSGAMVYYSETALPYGYGGLVIQAPWQGQNNARNIKVMGSSNGYFSIQSNLNASETFRATFEGGVNLNYYQSGNKLQTTPTGVTLNQDLTVNRNALITGISTFTGAIDANGDLDVDGHTNLDNTNIAGILTVTTSTQYHGYKLSNGSNIVGELVGLSGSNDSGALALWSGGSKYVQISASGASYITGGSLGIGTATIRNSRTVQITGASQSNLLITGNVPSVCLNTDPDDSTDGDRTFLGQAAGNNNFANGTAAGDTILRGTSSGKIHFGIGTAIKMHLTSAGDLNIGSVGRFDASGLVKSAHGTESAPSHTFLNDPDNGMYRPTTNTLGFVTGGTERVQIKNDGRVLIANTLGLGGATSNPSDLLHAQSTSGEGVIKLIGATDAKVRVQALNGDSYIQFGDASSDQAAAFQYDHGTDFLIFKHGSSSNRFTIDASGRAFFGVNPQGRLCRMHISGDNFPTVTAGGSQVPLIVSNQDADYGLQLGVYSSGNGFLQATRNDGVAANYNIIMQPAGGNVMINTFSSSSFNGVGQTHALVVAGDSSDADITDNHNAAITISNKNGTANNTAGLHFAREDTDGQPHYTGASVVAQFKETMNTGHYPKADLAFLTSTANNNAPSEKMRIHAEGYVTKPSNPCFQAVVNGSHVSANSYVVFGSADINVGNDYNTSNGIFTAPVAGVYLFHISSIAFNNATTVFRYYLKINNSNTGSGNDAHLRLDMTNDDNDYGPNASYTYYKYMNVNDTARVYFTPDDNSAQTYGPADYFKFAGHLVG